VGGINQGNTMLEYPPKEDAILLWVFSWMPQLSHLLVLRKKHHGPVLLIASNGQVLVPVVREQIRAQNPIQCREVSVLELCDISHLVDAEVGFSFHLQLVDKVEMIVPG
jgi:hypothetical protein